MGNVPYHVSVEAGEVRAERDKFRAALQEIVDPLKVMRDRAEANGHHLTSLAYSIAGDPHYIKEIARKALEK